MAIFKEVKTIQDPQFGKMLCISESELGEMYSRYSKWEESSIKKHTNTLYNSDSVHEKCQSYGNICADSALRHFVQDLYELSKNTENEIKLTAKYKPGDILMSKTTKNYFKIKELYYRNSVLNPGVNAIYVIEYIHEPHKGSVSYDWDVNIEDETKYEKIETLEVKSFEFKKGDLLIGKARPSWRLKVLDAFYDEDAKTYEYYVEIIGESHIFPTGDKKGDKKYISKSLVEGLYELFYRE